MEYLDYNRDAWNQRVASGNRWTVPVSEDVIARARAGQWSIVLTPTRTVPRGWFPDLKGSTLLCLAGAGGQQGPILAAAGARVTVFDLSPRQLEQDRFVAQRDGLDLTTVEGDMADLSAFDNNHFDVIVHPCSNCFVPDIRRVWKECHRVLKPAGVLLAGFVNPMRYIFEQLKLEKGEFEVCHRLPCSDADLTEVERQFLRDTNEPFEFSHTLEEQLAGQIEAGFALTGFYEDRYAGTADPLSEYLATFIATRATKI